MPWPHKNSDGVIPSPAPKELKDLYFGVELSKVSDWVTQYVPSPIPAKYQTDLLKSVYGSKVLGNLDKQEHVSKLYNDGVINYTQAKEMLYGLAYGGNPSTPEPPLIKATQPFSKVYWYKDIEKEYFPKVEPIKIQEVRQMTRIEIDGISKMIHHSTALDKTKDYSESEIRQVLMNGFAKMTDLIIKELKEKK